MIKKLFVCLFIVLYLSIGIFGSTSDVWDEDIWKALENNPNEFIKNIDSAFSQDTIKAFNIIYSNPSILNDPNAFDKALSVNSGSTWSIVDNRISVLTSSPGAYSKLISSVENKNIDINYFPNLKKFLLDDFGTKNQYSNVLVDSRLAIDDFDFSSNTITFTNSNTKLENGKNGLLVNGVLMTGKIDVTAVANQIVFSGQGNTDVIVNSGNYGNRILERGTLNFVEGTKGYFLGHNSYYRTYNKEIKTQKHFIHMIYDDDCPSNEINCYSHNGNIETLSNPSNLRNLRINFDPQNARETIFRVDNFNHGSGNNFHVKTGQGSITYNFRNKAGNGEAEVRLSGRGSSSDQNSGALLIAEVAGMAYVHMDKNNLHNANKLRELSDSGLSFGLKEDDIDRMVRAVLEGESFKVSNSKGQASSNTLSREFLNSVENTANRLGMPPKYLMSVIGFETIGSFRTDIRNPRSSATGLIQFMPKTARGLGTSTSQLARMSRVEQMYYVEKHYQPFAGRISTLEDAYMAVLWPAAVGRGGNYVLFSRGSKAYRLNRGLDLNRDGRVVASEATTAVTRNYPPSRYENLFQS
jgi:hypothetical protein